MRMVVVLKVWRDGAPNFEAAPAPHGEGVPQVCEVFVDALLGMGVS